jgi:hypothetical protein
MSHKLTSNSSVIYNAERQLSGVLEIIPEQITYQNDGASYHNVMINCPVKDSGTNNYVGGLNYNVTEDAWNTFFSSLTLTSTDEFGKQEEAALKYVLTQIDGDWGLTESDWTYSDI